MTSLVQQIGDPYKAPYITTDTPTETHYSGGRMHTVGWSIYNVRHPDHPNLHVLLHMKNCTRYYKEKLHDKDSDTPAVHIEQLQISYLQLADNKAIYLPPARNIKNYKSFWNKGKFYYECWDNAQTLDFQFPTRRSGHTQIEVRQMINTWKEKLTPYDLDIMSIEYIVNPIANMMFIQDILTPLMGE